MTKLFKEPLNAHCQIPKLDKLQYRVFGNTPGTLVEVGLYDGKTFSNTYHLLKSGWKGIGFEPVQALYDRAVRNLKGCNMKVIKEAVSTYKGDLKIYVGDALSTSMPDMVDVYGSLPWAIGAGLSEDKYELVPCDTLASHLKNNGIEPGFELLIVDVEGAEWPILQAFDIGKWSPIMCIVEVHEHHADAVMRRNVAEINEYFELAGYEKVFSDAINNIYVLRSHSLGLKNVI